MGRGIVLDFSRHMNYRRSSRICVCLGLFLAVAGLSLGGSPAWGFRIISPEGDSTVTSGTQVKVAVETGKETGISRVLYFWYRQGQEPEGLHQATPALIGLSSSSPPFGGLLTVPVNLLGEVRLLAVAEVARGRLTGHEEFDEIELQAMPVAALTSIEFETEKPWQLDTIGKILELPVVGQFSDHVIRPLGGYSTGSAYRSSDEKVVKVFSDGTAQATGNGKATITVTNREKQGVLPVTVRAIQENNHLPVAYAGQDLKVKAGNTVVLNGLGSNDPDGDPLRYEWTQIRGHKISLLDADSPKPTFVAPKVSSKRLLRFKLRVTDMKGPDTVKGGDSLPSYVNVWVEP